jgi:hypothetical protein
MQANARSALAKGQVWKTRAADIEIMALGKRHIHYKVTKRLGHKHISAQICGTEALENYLQFNAARLVKAGSLN